LTGKKKKEGDRTGRGGGGRSRSTQKLEKKKNAKIKRTAGEKYGQGASKRKVQWVQNEHRPSPDVGRKAKKGENHAEPKVEKRDVEKTTRGGYKGQKERDQEGWGP